MSSKSKRQASPHRPFESRTDKGKFLKICHDMMDSCAWKALSRSAKCLYIEMKARYTAKYSNGQFIADNSLDVSFPASKAKELYSDLRTFRADIDALIDCGFIDLVSSGWNTRTANIYGFSERWKKFGQPHFETPINVKRPKQRKIIRY